MDEVKKKCGACGVEKELKEFGVNSRYKDNLQPKCRLCIKNKISIFVDTGEKDCYLYRHLKPSGELFYIGIGSGNNNYKRAYTKTGRNKNWYKIVENFGYEVQILTSGLTRAEAEELEILLIAYYRREDCCDGVLCNLTDGGGGNTGLKHSKETKLKMSETRKGQRMGKDNHCFGKKLTKEHRKAISDANTGGTWTNEQREKYRSTRTGCIVSEEAKRKTSEGLKKYYETHDNVNKGKPMSEETKKKLSASHTGKVGLVGKDNPMYGMTGSLNPMYGRKHTEEVKQMSRERMWKKVINVETLEIFPCADQAAETIGKKGYSLQPYLRGEACSYLPFMYLDDYNEGKTIVVKEKKKKTKKQVIDTETLVVYPTTADAVKKTGVTNISYHINKNTVNYRFMYLTQYQLLNPEFKND